MACPEPAADTLYFAPGNSKWDDPINFSWAATTSLSCELTERRIRRAIHYIDTSTIARSRQRR